MKMFPCCHARVETWKHFEASQSRSVLECGGKRSSATPLFGADDARLTSETERTKDSRRVMACCIHPSGESGVAEASRPWLFCHRTPGRCRAPMDVRASNEMFPCCRARVETWKHFEVEEREAPMPHIKQRKCSLPPTRRGLKEALDQLEIFGIFSPENVSSFSHVSTGEFIPGKDIKSKLQLTLAQAEM